MFDYNVDINASSGHFRNQAPQHRRYESAPTISDPKSGSTGRTGPVKLPKSLTPKKWTKAAFLAVEMDDHVVLGAMVKTRKQANWRERDELSNSLMSLLESATVKGSPNCVRLLLERGADPNELAHKNRPFVATNRMPIGFYHSPLAHAIAVDNAEIFEMLLGAGGKLELPCVVQESGKVLTCLDVLKGTHGHVFAWWEQREMRMHTLPEASSHAPAEKAGPLRI